MEISSRFSENHIMPKMLTILKVLSIMQIKENLIRNEQILKYERGIIMKNIIKKSISTILILAMALTLVIPMQTQAAGKVRLNRTKATLTMTDTKAKPTVQLKVTGTSKKATWTTSNKTVATVSKSGKVTAKKSGSVKITAKVSGKKYTCKVTVTDKKAHLSKTKVTLTITKKKTKPAVQLKVKNAAGKKVKWTTSNKKVITVNKNGKVVAKKKGSAVVKAKVGKKTLTCKITVKDNRKTAKTPVKTPTPNPTPIPTECQHDWKEHVVTTGTAIICNGCNQKFTTMDEFNLHSLEMELAGDYNHSGCGITPITTVDYEYCTKCGAKRNVQ